MKSVNDLLTAIQTEHGGKDGWRKIDALKTREGTF